MPARLPRPCIKLEKRLRGLGQELRDRRKSLGVSATVTAEAAGMSRVTLHRIERGESSVTMGAYLSVISALGLELDLFDPRSHGHAHGPSAGDLPRKIRLATYPQLKRLAWQLQDTKEVSPQEALDLYERNWRHVDLKTMDPQEREFLNSLLLAFGRKRLLV